MAAGYDENVLENPFFKALTGKYRQIYEDASAKRLTICVPRFGSLGRSVPTLNDIENHILITLPDNEKCFETLNKREVIVDGHLLRTSSGFHDVRQVEILFEETFFNANKESFSILCIERPLEGGTGLSTNALGPLETIQDCIEFLWPPYGGPYSSKQNVDQYLESYLSTWKVEFGHLGALMGDVLFVLNKLFPIVMKETHLRKPAKSGNFIETIKLALETYALHKLHEKLFPALCSLSSQKDAGFNKVVRNLSDIQLKDLGIKSALRQNIPSARRALSTLNHYTTPLEKFNCLKRTIVGVTMLKDAKTQDQGKVLAVTADDLLPVLECLVIKSELPNWMANLTYLHNFRFSNRTYDEFRFYMSSFEAAVEYIRKCHHKDRRLDVSLKPKFLDPSDMSSTSDEILAGSSTQEESSNVPVQGPSPLEVFFQHVTNCRDIEIKRVLNSSSTRVKLCHPLCSCDQCEKILDRHRNDPEAITVFSRDDLGRTALHMASDYGHTSTIHLLVQKGCVVNTTDYHGSTPLHLACQRGHQHATMLLLHYNADILAQDNDGNIPIHLCCSNGHEECAKALVYFDLQNEELDVNALNKHGDTPLHLSARWGFENIVKLLLDNGASSRVVNKRNEKPLDCACNLQIKRLLSIDVESQYVVITEDSVKESRVRPVSSVDIDKSRKIDRNQSQIEGFLKTVLEGDIRMVYHKLGIEDEWDEDDESPQSPSDSAPNLCHPLCQCEKCRKYQQDVTPSPYRKVDIDSRGLDGKTALHLSALYGFEHITSVLLKHGANPNIANSNRKCTPLHLACQYNHPKVVSILLQHHADVDCQDIRWNSPLHYCCQNGNIEPAIILIKNGATLSIVNERGNTPLHDAARWNCIGIVHLLLENDAPLNIKNVQGLTPLQMAKHDDIVKVLSEGSTDESSEKSDENKRRKQWRQPTIKNPSKVETVLQNDIVSSSSLSQTQELNDFVDATRDEPFSRIDHSTLARDSDSTTLPSSAFFDRKSPDLFSSSSLSSSLPQPSSDVPFPRKLPEINSKSSEDTDHRAIAIESLQQLLAGIKYFDRQASLRKTRTIDKSDPLTSPLLKLQFSIRHFDPSRLRRVPNRSEVEGNAGEIGIDSDTTGLNNVVENRTSLVNADVE